MTVTAFVAKTGLVEWTGGALPHKDVALKIAGDERVTIWTNSKRSFQIWISPKHNYFAVVAYGTVLQEGKADDEECGINVS